MRTIQAELAGLGAVVTGGSRGIGEAIATALAENGATVVVNYRKSTTKADEIAEELAARGRQIFPIQADVSKAPEAERLIEDAKERVGGSIDILVNNVGTQLFQCSVEETALDRWNRIFEINLASAVVCSRAVVGDMKRKKWGRIINITSISGDSGGAPGIVHYASTKAALKAFTKGLAKEVGGYGITVNAIAPGVILTDLHAEFSTEENLSNALNQTALKRLGQPADVAGAAVFLASDSASYITGETIAVNGGLRMD